MELKDVLHYYLGCECIVDMSRYLSGKGKHYDLIKVPAIFDSMNRNRDINQFVGVTMQCGERGVEYYDVFDKLCNCYSNFVHPENIKLKLRPLSSMTEEECADVYTIERDRILHPPTNDHDVRRGDKCWKVVRLDLIDTTLFITDEAIVYKVTEEDKMPMIEFMRNLPEIFNYLLKQGFDLFGLIESGQAIDATNPETN